MSCTVEDFKTAFTEQASSGDLQCQDEQVAAELKRFKSLVALAVKAGVASDGDNGRLTGLVKRYDAARKQNGRAPRETGAEFRSIREEARNRIMHFEQVLAAGTPLPAGNPGLNAAPAPPIGPDTQPQSQPKQAYEMALALLKPRIPRSSQGGSDKTAALELSLFDIEARMEAAAAKGDYNTALTLLRELETKLAEYEAAKQKEEPQRNKQEYARRLPALQPRLATVIGHAATMQFLRFTAEQQEIMRLNGQMTDAATAGDHGKALGLLTTLEEKLNAYDTKLAELQKKKTEYERRLAAVQARLAAVILHAATLKYPQLAAAQQEIMLLNDQAKQAAAKLDYEQALKLLTTLEGKLTAYDTDFDGLPNAIDSDDDNDRVPDYQDSAPTDATRSRDTDGDGIDDSRDDDIDNDGIKNSADDDDDGDGNSDAFEDRVNASLERLRTRNDPLLNRVLDTAINNRLDRNGDGDKRDTDLFDRAVGLAIGGETSGIGNTDMRLGDCAVNQRDVDFDGTVAHESAHATQRSMLPGNDADGDTLPDTIPLEFRGTEFDRIKDADPTTADPTGRDIREREAQTFETTHTGSSTGLCEPP